jgi:hypothetical protein
MVKVFLSYLLVAAGLVVAGIAAQGCGNAGAQGGDSTYTGRPLPPVPPEVAAYKKPTPAYTELLKKLKAAADAGRIYKAPLHSKNLGPVEKAAVNWFCVTAWQLVVNKELDNIPDAKYLSERLSVRVMLKVSDSQYSDRGRAPYLAPVAVAVNEFKRIIDLRSFGPKQDKRYKRACYGD